MNRPISILEQLKNKDLELNELKAINREQNNLISRQTNELRKITQFYQELEDENALIKTKFDISNFEKEKYKQMNEEFNDVLVSLMKNNIVDDKVKEYEDRISEINKKVDNIKNENDIINARIAFVNNKNQSLNDLIILKNEQIKDIIHTLLPNETKDPEELSNNLQLISKLEEGDTISTSSKCILAHNLWYTTLYRTCNQETRTSTFKWIKSVFYESLYILIIDKNPNFKEKINAAISRMPHLIKTYEQDNLICSKIKKLVFKIKLILQIYEYL